MAVRYMSYADLPFANAPDGVCRWCGQPATGRRKRWCSDECVQEYEVRCSGSALRYAVWQRDRGKCSRCGRDCETWEAHHKHACKDGGGACGLDNVETLCVACHRAETAAQRRKHLPAPPPDTQLKMEEE
jgi:hypothetical protein